MSHGWGPYPETVLHFPEIGLRLDLRLPLSPAILQQLAELGLGGSFAVVTACNPLGSDLDEVGNRRLATVLARLVRDRYPGAHPALGGSPDGSHEESGWALPVPLEDARQLAAQFLQNALFWFEGGRVLIVPVLGPGPDLPLPPAAGRR